MSKSISPTVPLAVAPAALAGVITEGVLYGFVVLLTAASQYSLLFRKHATHNIPLTLASLLLFGLATAHFAVDVAAMFKAFAILDPVGRIGVLANATNKLNIIKVLLYDISMVVGDAVVIYRAWMVFGQNLWIVTPAIILSIASAIIEFLTIYVSFHPTTHLGLAMRKNIANYGVEGFVLSLVANLYATALITFKIWRNEFNRSPELRYARRSLLPIAMILIESGALNAAYLITYIGVLVATRKPGNKAIVADMVVIDIASSITAIVFSMVIVQVALRSKEQELRLTGSNSGVSSSLNWRWPSSVGHSTTAGGTEGPTTVDQPSAMNLELVEDSNGSSSSLKTKPEKTEMV